MGKAHKSKLNTVETFLRNHTLTVLVICMVLAAAITGLVVFAVTIKKNNQSNSTATNSTNGESSLKVTESQQTPLSSAQTTADSATEPSSSSTAPANNSQKTQQSSTPTAPTSTPQQSTPAVKQPITLTFFSGTVTPVLMQNQPPNSYSNWGNYSTSYDISGYTTAKISWFIDQTADPAISIEISYDGSNWITYMGAINSGKKSGNLTFDVPAQYIRIYNSNGSCVPGYCEDPRPTWAQPYSTTVTGYFSN